MKILIQYIILFAVCCQGCAPRVAGTAGKNIAVVVDCYNQAKCSCDGFSMELYQGDKLMLRKKSKEGTTLLKGLNANTYLLKVYKKEYVTVEIRFQLKDVQDSVRVTLNKAHDIY